MKGLNKIALIAAIAAATTAQAEMVAMDDSAMSATTGQAGLTIDVNSATINIGEIAYKDEGFIGISDFSLTGAHGSALDDIRIFVDVAGGASDFGGAQALGQTYLTGAAAAKGLTLTHTATFDPIAVADGDLIIAIRGQNGVVDYGLNIGSVDLAASNTEIGGIAAAATGTTTLVSNLSLNGIIGPIDMVIHNDGGTEASMEINAYFNVVDQSGGVDTNANKLTLDFLDTTLGFELHNFRGADQIHLGSKQTSFAHAQLAIGQFDGVDAAGAAVSGLKVELKDFSGDMDLTNITLGQSASIGDLYITDMKITADMRIYGH